MSVSHYPNNSVNPNTTNLIIARTDKKNCLTLPLYYNTFSVLFSIWSFKLFEHVLVPAYPELTFYCIPFHMSSCIHTSTPHPLLDCSHSCHIPAVYFSVLFLLFCQFTHFTTLKFCSVQVCTIGIKLRSHNCRMCILNVRHRGSCVFVWMSVKKHIYAIRYSIRQ